MGSQKCFNILFRIFGYLLELVNGHNARSVGLGQVLKNFIERIFRALYIPQLNIESRETRNGVETEFPTDGFDGLDKERRHFPAARQEAFVYFTSKEVG